MSDTQGERIAVLETKVENQADAIAKMEETLSSMAASQQQILAELTKYRTIWGVITMVVTALIAAVGFFKDCILGNLK